MIEFSDEKFLLDEIKKGNNQAFEYLFKTYYPRLRGYAIRFVEDEETARDIIQECFLRFWEKRAFCRQYRSHLCFLRWCVMDA